MNVCVAKKKRKSGIRYYVVVETGRENGRPVKKWQPGSYRTKAEANKAARDVERRIDEDKYVAPGKDTLGEYLDDWIKNSLGIGAIRPSTASLYETVRRAYVVPRIGSKPLHALRAKDLDRLYADLTESGSKSGGALAKKTVRHVHTLIHKALADAVEQGLIGFNPAERARSPRAARPKMKAWSAEELRRFLEVASSDDLFPAWRLASTTGMRRGEILGVRVGDLDLDRARLSVQQTVILVGSQVRISDVPKTDKGRRTIPLETETLAALKAQRARLAERKLAFGLSLSPDDLLFSELTDPIHPTSFSRRFRKLREQAGVTPIRFHDVRHTFATLALQAGIPVKVVSEILGHANIAITLDTYSHVIPSMMEDAVDKVAALFRVASDE